MLRILLALLGVLLPPTGMAEPLATARVQAGTCILTVEIAETSSQRSRGLMHREILPIDNGMLFVFARPQVLSFWMRNTLIPLDIAFMDPQMAVLAIERMAPLDETQMRSPPGAQFALEANAGRMAECGVERGTRIRMLE